MGRYIRKDPLGIDAGVNLYNYVACNPLKRSDIFGLEWGYTDAFKHYYFGKGADVSINEMGLYDTITSDVHPKMNDWKTKAEKKAREVASTLSCPGFTKTTISKADSVGVRTSIYWIRGISFHRKYWCTITADCCKKKYFFSCNLEYSMMDEFSEILDIDNSASDPWDDWTLGGTSYYITGNWSDSIIGWGDVFRTW